MDRALEAGGLSPSDVTPTLVNDFQAVSAALSTGAVDAAVVPQQFVVPLVNSGIATRWLLVGEIVPDMQIGVLVFSRNLMANHKLAVRTMMAYLCGARDYTDAFFKDIGRDQVVQELIQATSIKDPSLYDQMSYATVDPNGKVNLANLHAS